MPTDRRMDKEDVVHIYHAILLSHKKEQHWVICWDVDGSRDCHTEWNKSEREKQISYINAYMWNLEKWHGWTGLQGRNWDTEVEKKRRDTKGGKRQGAGGGGVMNWVIVIDMYTLMCIKLMTNKNLLYKKTNSKIKKKNYSKKKKNQIMAFAATWMDLEIIILSEGSQTEKDNLSYDLPYMWILF